ncbi:sigma-54-dependent transcriptional regulator [Granulicella tundricola]|uniref:Two component, sigma54 specific, transcriptional regulator, Fis family n=1 Tax=Granulicella tundricola (strain ATCC BAA-1859 / DSM 23138 / MP5ACTX9) TaxID=1198114 RepID=E8WXI8_GRATM|nr:sigma-54 dependent transcriptional regulator [Granulicella tundricola]ADW68604.1 two component, sigma54 specific, transcriptional regulator, Fis family [Granulicella tundricola MP5ACTX9]
MQEKVLIVEDEIHARTGLAELVASWGYRTECAADGAEGLDMVTRWSPAIVVTDLKMPRMDGMELLNRISERPERIRVVMLTAQGSIESAVEAMRMGAYDYLPKPVEPARLKAILQSASRQVEADEDVETPIRVAKSENTLGDMVGTSPEMKAVFKLIERVAPSNVSVLVTGESGTGKELVARALHDLSGRRNKAFVAVNCAAIPETLIESEIFGHEKGAFTGALERRAGCFELAEEGTLLLDEIGEMPAATQAKLLRVLEDRKLRRLGSKTETPVDVRVVAATNKDPERAVSAGELRGDLYYRLNVFNIQMPPLRAHVSDVPIIAEKMIADMNERHGCSVTGASEELMSRLLNYKWPGNVRELRNTIERAVILAGKGLIGVEHLPPHFGEAGFAPKASGAPAAQGPALSDTAVHVEVGTTVDEAERQLILKTLTSTHNNKTRAAEILGVSTKTLQNKLKEYAAAGLE